MLPGTASLHEHTGGSSDNVIATTSEPNVVPSMEMEVTVAPEKKTQKKRKKSVAERGLVYWRVQKQPF